MDEMTRLRQAFTLEPLLDAALRESGTGAKEFRDTGFIANLEKVLAIPDNIPISQTGLNIMLVNSVRFLVNRLRWEADVAQAPGDPRRGCRRSDRRPRAAPLRHDQAAALPLRRSRAAGDPGLGDVEPGAVSRRAARRSDAAAPVGRGDDERGDQHRRNLPEDARVRRRRGGGIELHPDRQLRFHRPVHHRARLQLPRMVPLDRPPVLAGLSQADAQVPAVAAGRQARAVAAQEPVQHRRIP